MLSLITMLPLKLKCVLWTFLFNFSTQIMGSPLVTKQLWHVFIYYFTFVKFSCSSRSCPPPTYPHTWCPKSYLSHVLLIILWVCVILKFASGLPRTAYIRTAGENKVHSVPTLSSSLSPPTSCSCISFCLWSLSLTTEIICNYPQINMPFIIPL